MTLGEMVVLLLLASLFLVIMVSAFVLVFLRQWLIVRDKRDHQHQDLESAVVAPRESSDSALHCY